MDKVVVAQGFDNWGEMTRLREEVERLTRRVETQEQVIGINVRDNLRLECERDRMKAALERIKGCAHDGVRCLPPCYVLAVEALGPPCFCGHCLDCLRRERGGLSDSASEG